MLQMTAIGRVGSDAQVKQVGNRFVINFAIALNKKKVNKDTGELTEETRWINCALWRDEPGSLTGYLKKGTQVFVQGEPETSVYRKKDNTPGIDTRINVARLELLGSKKEEGSEKPNNGDEAWHWDEAPADAPANVAAAADAPAAADDDAMPWDNEPDPAPAAATSSKKK